MITAASILVVGFFIVCAIDQHALTVRRRPLPSEEPEIEVTPPAPRTRTVCGDGI